MSSKFLLLGASRGLGAATYKQLLLQYPEAEFLLSSRKILAHENLKAEKTNLIAQDFSKTPMNQNFLAQAQSFQPTHVIYFAGGGPYGNFADKKWSDHLWALNTTFLYPAELLHQMLSQKQNWPRLMQVILIGSSVAENQPDPLAASYAAAKHALKGLVSTVNLETNLFKIKLFSPGYMQTDLLPLNSEPRQNKKAEDPVEVAKKLIAFIEKND
jgi:short-subunit dehydrogenase